MLVGLIAASVLARGSLLKGLAMAVLGLIIGVIGQDQKHRLSALHLRAAASSTRASISS